MNKRKLNFIKCRLRNEPFLTFEQKTWKTFSDSELREAVGIEAEGQRFGWNTILMLMLNINNKYNDDFFREVYENTLEEYPTLKPADQNYVLYHIEEFAKKETEKEEEKIIIWSYTQFLQFLAQLHGVQPLHSFLLCVGPFLKKLINNLWAEKNSPK